MEPGRSATFLCALLLAPLVASGLSASHLGRLTFAAQEAAPQQGGECPRVTLQPMTLAYNIDELAGQHVRILNARVKQVLEPRAFLIEPVTRYTMPTGYRDRVLVLIDGGSLRLPAEGLVGSTVTIFGIARTLLGERVSPEVPWPSAVDRHLIKDLEVRAAVLATSIQAPEGTELTQPAGSDPSPAGGC